MRSRVALRLLLHDRSSTGGALLGVVAIVFLVGQQLSILFGLLQYMSVLVDHSGADVWITSTNIRNVDATNLISGRFLDRVIGLPEVEWAEPILLGNGLMRTADGSFEAVKMVGLRRPRLAGGPWAFFKGQAENLIDLEAVAVDKLDMAKFGEPTLPFLTEINGWRIRIQAVTQGARAFQGTLVFTSLDKIKDMAATPPGRYSAILVRFRPGTDVAHAVARLRAMLPECSVLTTLELARLTQYYYLTNTGIGGSFGFSTSIAVLIGIVIITLTMYASVLGRTRDFAVMRALGGAAPGYCHLGDQPSPDVKQCWDIFGFSPPGSFITSDPRFRYTELSALSGATGADGHHPVCQSPGIVGSLAQGLAGRSGLSFPLGAGGSGRG